MEPVTASRTTSASSAGVTLRGYRRPRSTPLAKTARSDLAGFLDQSPHSRHQVVRVERFGEVGIDTDALAAFEVGLLCPCSHQHDAHRAEFWVLAQPRRGLPTV